MSIGQQIRKYRKALGLTLEQLCALSGVEPGTISALENRGSDRSVHFAAIARAMGLTIEQLTDESRTYPATPVNAVMPSTVALQAREPVTPYGWPFREVKPDEWASLTRDEMDLIEKTAIMLIKAKNKTKQLPPAYNSAAA